MGWWLLFPPKPLPELFTRKKGSKGIQ